MEKGVIVQCDKADLEAIMVAKLEKSVYDKWHHVLLTSKEAAKFHQVHEQTVKKYADLGYLQSASVNPYKFRASEVLQWNFDKLKYSRI